MKKLCVIMLALLLAVPALATAEKVPSEMLKLDNISEWSHITISPREDIVTYIYEFDGVTDRFNYFLSGVMRDYIRDLGSGRNVKYSPSGEISENNIGDDLSDVPAYDPVTPNKNTVMAPMKLEDLLKEKGVSSIEALYQGGVAADDIVISDGTITVPDNVDWVAAGRIGSCEILTKTDGSYIYSGDSPSYVLVKTGKMISVFNIRSNTAVLEKVYVDSLRCYVQGGYTHMTGDTKYTDTIYNADGIREHYFLYSSDLKVKTAYDDKNRLQSHETWTQDKAYWKYEEDEKNGGYVWWTSADGDPANAHVETEIPAEVLESLLLTDVVAEYDVGAPLSNASQLDADNEGLPFIVSTDANLKNAVVNVVSELVNATTTTFNITPTSGDAAVQPAGGTTLYLPLPNGMDAQTAKGFGITVEHKGEVFSTIDGTATVTEQGVRVNATSYSPYTVIWGEDAEKAYNASAGKGAGDLPKTGDDSHMMLCLAMLAVSGTLLLSLRRKTA